MPMVADAQVPPPSAGHLEEVATIVSILSALGLTGVLAQIIERVIHSKFFQLSRYLRPLSACEKALQVNALLVADGHSPTPLSAVREILHEFNSNLARLELRTRAQREIDEGAANTTAALGEYPRSDGALEVPRSLAKKMKAYERYCARPWLIRHLTVPGVVGPISLIFASLFQVARLCFVGVLAVVLVKLNVLRTDAEAASVAVISAAAFLFMFQLARILTRIAYRQRWEREAVDEYVRVLNGGGDGE